MSVKLLTEYHLEFLSLKEAAQARLSLHLSKCHIVGNHMSRLIFPYFGQLMRYRYLSNIQDTICHDNPGRDENRNSCILNGERYQARHKTLIIR